MRSLDLSAISFVDLLPSLVTALGVVGVLWSLFFLLSKGIHKLAERTAGSDEARRADVDAWASRMETALRRTFRVLAVGAIAFLTLRGLGLGGMPRFSWLDIAGWLAGPFFRIVLVAGAAYLLTRMLNMLLARLPSLLGLKASGDSLLRRYEQRQRLDTISRLLQNVSTVVVMGTAGLIILRELGLDITPILTGLGIGGLALGFGAQNLVRDLISGFFIIAENQVAVGDVATINGKSGLVEAIRLRTIVLRGLDGTVHIIPNGAITELSNMTKEFSYYVIDLGVSYKEDTDRVVAAVNEVAAELRRDPAFAAKILDDLEVLGVDQFADSAVIIKVRIKTAPIQQWSVGRELRRRIKHAFDAQGIEIPFPQVTVHSGETNRSFEEQLAERARKD